MDTNLNLLFWLYKAKKNSSGKAPIYLRITIGGSRAGIACNHFVLPKKWDNKRQHVKGNGDEAEAINDSLKIIRTKLLTTHNALKEQELPITAELLKLSYLGKGMNAKTMLQAFESHNKQLQQRIGSDVSSSTFRKYETVYRKMKSFISKVFNRGDVFLKELDYQFIMQFELYLKNQEKVNHNTTMKYIKFVKRIINYSITNGWLDKNPFINFKCKFQQRLRGYLTADELNRIESKAITIQRVMVVRDVFVFCCYTGLSFSDVEKLRNTNIVSKDGGKWIVILRTKTGVRSAIPLLPQALCLLARYQPPFEPDNEYKLFPVLSNQKMNAYLKEVADICGVRKNLTMHLARHTFATTVTLTNGVPIETVSKMLGHTSISTTQIYSKVVDTKIGNDMQVLQQKLSVKAGE